MSPRAIFFKIVVKIAKQFRQGLSCALTSHQEKQRTCGRYGGFNKPERSDYQSKKLTWKINGDGR